MTAPATRQVGRRGSSPAATLGAVIVASALALTGCATRGGPSTDSSTTLVPATTGRPATTAPEAPEAKGSLERSAAPRPQAADPRRIRIPAIGVSSQVIPLRLDGNRKLIAPERFDVTGWNRTGPEPGETGVAVIAGHVDSYRGPAVFFELRNLRPGHEIHVDRADGSTVTFVVDRQERHPKTGVPDSVYTPTPDPQLRLITCGGAFDRSRRSYVDNLVVYASMP